MASSAPFSKSKTSNEVARKGGLPPAVRSRARAIMRESPGFTLSRAIATAIAQYKKEAAKGSAKAAKVVAAWEALKGRMNAD